MSFSFCKYYADDTTNSYVRNIVRHSGDEDDINMSFSRKSVDNSFCDGDLLNYDNITTNI